MYGTFIGKTLTLYRYIPIASEIASYLAMTQ